MLTKIVEYNENYKLIQYNGEDLLITKNELKKVITRTNSIIKVNNQKHSY